MSVAMPRTSTRGVVYVHSTPKAPCPHILWAVEGVLGRRLSEGKCSLAFGIGHAGTERILPLIGPGGLGEAGGKMRVERHAFLEEANGFRAGGRQNGAKERQGAQI